MEKITVCDSAEFGVPRIQVVRLDSTVGLTLVSVPDVEREARREFLKQHQQASGYVSGLEAVVAVRRLRAVLRQA
jgi:hypothetical protein